MFIKRFMFIKNFNNISKINSDLIQELNLHPINSYIKIFWESDNTYYKAKILDYYKDYYNNIIVKVMYENGNLFHYINEIFIKK